MFKHRIGFGDVDSIELQVMRNMYEDLVVLCVWIEELEEGFEEGCIHQDRPEWDVFNRIKRVDRDDLPLDEAVARVFAPDVWSGRTDAGSYFMVASRLESPLLTMWRAAKEIDEDGADVPYLVEQAMERCRRRFEDKEDRTAVWGTNVEAN